MKTQEEINELCSKPMKLRLDAIPRDYDGHMKVRRILGPDLPEWVGPNGIAVADMYVCLRRTAIRAFRRWKQMLKDGDPKIGHKPNQLGWICSNDVLETARHRGCVIEGIQGDYLHHVCTGTEIIKPPVGGWK